jgi:hypothetical protein
MKTLHPTSLCCLPLLLGASAVWAQTTPDATPTASEVAPTQVETSHAPEQVGDATRRLLAQQRQGLHASTVDRSIDGSVAARSHERYLKSFDHPLPEWFGSRLSESN